MNIYLKTYSHNPVRNPTMVVSQFYSKEWHHIIIRLSKKKAQKILRVSLNNSYNDKGS